MRLDWLIPAPAEPVATSLCFHCVATLRGTERAERLPPGDAAHVLTKLDLQQRSIDKTFTLSRVFKRCWAVLPKSPCLVRHSYQGLSLDNTACQI